MMGIPKIFITPRPIRILTEKLGEFNSISGGFYENLLFKICRCRLSSLCGGCILSISFFLAHGLIDFSQLNLLTVVPTILFFAAIYATIAGIKRLTSRRISFEFTFEGIYVYPRLFFSKEIFIPKEELLRASYVESGCQ